MFCNKINYNFLKLYLSQVTLETGVEIDSSYTDNQPVTFTLGSGQVIKGWDQGLMG